MVYTTKRINFDDVYKSIFFFFPCERLFPCQLQNQEHKIFVTLFSLATAGIGEGA